MNTLRQLVMFECCTVLLSCSAWALDPIILDPSCEFVQGLSLRVIGSRPAMSYRCGDSVELRFAIATDSAGTQWTEPVVVDDSCNHGRDSSLRGIDGRPAIVYDNYNLATDTGDLRYIRANDASGASWPAPLIVSSGVFHYVSLDVVDGHPALASATKGGDLVFARADDVFGTSWPALQVLAVGAREASILSFGALPAIGFFDRIVGKVFYLPALNEQASAWGTPVLVAAGDADSLWHLQFADVNGNPAACFSKGYELHFVRALTPDGSSWDSSKVLADIVSGPSFEIVDGRAAIAYVDFTGVWYLSAADVDGETWNPTVRVIADEAGTYVQLVEAGGLPAVGYAATFHNEIRYIAAHAADFRSVNISPLVADFGFVETGENVTLSLTITSYLEAPLRITANRIIGANAHQFRVISGGAPFSLDFGETHEIIISFRASPPGEKLATLELTTDNPNQPELLTPIRGWASNCKTQAITSQSDAGGEHTMITLAANGRSLAFASDSDLVAGQNADHNREIFVWETGRGISQVTRTEGFVNNSPSISMDGHWVVFESEADIVEGGNTDGSRELYLYKMADGSLTQLTDFTEIGFSQANVSDHAETISCVSRADFGANVDGSWEIFLLDVASGSFHQITETVAGSNWFPRLSGSGNAVVFQSDLDIVDGLNEDGNTEIFLYREGEGISQITHTAGGYKADPEVDQFGSSIVFQSTNDLVPGGNLDGSWENFLWQEGMGFTQITRTTEHARIYPGAIDDSGERVIFVAAAELVEGLNDDASEEVFLYDIPTGTFSQVTYLPPGEVILPVASGGARIHAAFNCTFNITSSPDAGASEIYLSTCGLTHDDFMTGDLRHWIDGSATTSAPSTGD